MSERYSKNSTNWSWYMLKCFYYERNIFNEKCVSLILFAMLRILCLLTTRIFAMFFEYSSEVLHLNYILNGLESMLFYKISENYEAHFSKKFQTDLELSSGWNIKIYINKDFCNLYLPCVMIYLCRILIWWNAIHLL